jgi:peptidoglycan/xylan/chitin deacetylase (PgdA/CDA1 family)
VALVFEDGPAAAPPRLGPSGARWRGNGPDGRRKSPSDAGITDILLDILAAYGASATFAVVGSTASNYPDEPGPAGSGQSGGLAYDHYPEYGRDALGGVVSQGETVRRMLAGGHELCNHSYRHIPFGPQPGGQRRRVHHLDADSSLDDLAALHNHVRESFGVEMRLGRPPHLVDGPAFDLYRALGYNYVGMGCDGGGRQASSGSYDNDVETMVLGLQRVLEKDARALSGWIISYKDGYDLSGQSPVVAALPRVTQLFRNYGYRAVTVSALLAGAPFADLGADHPAFAAVTDLLRRGFWVACRDNEVRPNAPVERGNLAVWSLGAVEPGRADGEIAVYADVPVGHPYRWHVEEAARRGFWRGFGGKGLSRPSDPGSRGSRVFGLRDTVGPEEFREVMGRAGVEVAEIEGVREVKPGGGLTRARALVLIHEALGGGAG